MTLEQQLADLIRRAEDPRHQLMAGLLHAVSIMEDANRRGAEEAAAYLNALMNPNAAPRPMNEAELAEQFRTFAAPRH